MTSGEIAFLNRRLTKLSENKENNETYINIYAEYGEPLKMVLSSYHYCLNNTFEYMNTQIRNKYYYFHADPSRAAIKLFSDIENTFLNIKSMKICLCNEYFKKIDEIKKFIMGSGGTKVPESFREIFIIEIDSIFIVEGSFEKKGKKIFLSAIGRGSYADVYKYFDEDYEKFFVLKRAKKTLDTKELSRFKREFEIMKEFKSPYITEVYTYNEERKEYTMELLDDTIFDFIDKKNNNLSFEIRFNLINQILKCFFICRQKKYCIEILALKIFYLNILRTESK